MSISEALLSEFQHEAIATRRMLELVPEDQLDFKPHEKSMTLGRLAGHLAEIPQWADNAMTTEELNMNPGDGPGPFEATSQAGLLATFDKNVELCSQALSGRDDADFAVVWKMRMGDKEIISMPRAAVIRVWVLNHLYHHRGQLSVYLRLLDRPLPAVYGPTADASGFD